MPGVQSSDVRPFLLSGVPTHGDTTLKVTSPWDGALVGEVSVPTADQIEQAIVDLDAVRLEAQALPAHVRAGALDGSAKGHRPQTEGESGMVPGGRGGWSRHRDVHGRL